MKIMKRILCIVSIALVLPSCFLFRGNKGGHCPAYGQVAPNEEFQPKEFNSKTTIENIELN